MKNSFLRIIFLLSSAYIALFVYGLLYSDELIFFPPEASYRWSDELVRISTIDAGVADRSMPGAHSIVARHLQHADSQYTILYSHGNASDLGRIRQRLQYFYDHGFSVIGYDYSGYGLSEGEPSEQQVYNDVKAVYDYLIDVKKLRPEQIIAYGHSLGAAIATDLAFNNEVAGLVLESPFVTAFRVQTTYPLLPIDKFSTIDKIASVKTPVFILHSRDDTVIPFWHGESLFDKARQPKYSLWLDGGGHSSIIRQPIFWSNFDRFVSQLSI